MRKKIILLFSLLLVVYGMLNTQNRMNVMAATLEDDNSEPSLTVYLKTGEIEVISIMPQDEVIIPSTKGSGLPKFFKSLINSPYTYNIYNMKEYVNTDCYFDTDSNGGLAISTNGLNSGGKSIEIKLYKYNGGYDTLVSTYKCDPQSIQGLGYNNLSTTPGIYYWFQFRTVDSGTTVSGSGKIHHP